MKEAIDLKPAFLTRNEFEWLQGKIQLSASYQRKIKSDIRKKLRVFQALELPLLNRTGFITAATANCNAATANCNVGTSEVPILRLNNMDHAQLSDNIVGRKGFEPSIPAMSRRCLDQAGPPALRDSSAFSEFFCKTVHSFSLGALS